MFSRFLSHPLSRLIRLDKPVGVLLLLWPTLTSLWFAADGWPGWQLTLVMVLGTFCMRSAGCALNDYADRDLDGAVERTRTRPLATGELRPRTALITAVVLVLVAALLVLSTNLQASLVALACLPVVALYPYFKRYSNYPQLVLGIAFSWGVPVAWVAAGGVISSPALLALFAGTWCWVVAYDTEYAMCDRRDDLKAGVGSTAIGFGPHERLAVAVFQLLALVGWWRAGQLSGAGSLYGAGLLLVALLFINQLRLIRDRDAAACLTAFNRNMLAGAVLALAVRADHIRSDTEILHWLYSLLF